MLILPVVNNYRRQILSGLDFISCFVYWLRTAQGATRLYYPSVAQRVE